MERRTGPHILPSLSNGLPCFSRYFYLISCPLCRPYPGTPPQKGIPLMECPLAAASYGTSYKPLPCRSPVPSIRLPHISPLSDRGRLLVTLVTLFVVLVLCLPLSQVLHIHIRDVELFRFIKIVHILHVYFFHLTHVLEISC